MKPQELFANYYPRQCTLLDYLSAVKERLHSPSDTKAYNNMLKQTIVCCHDNEVDLRSFTPSVREGFHMRDVLQRVIEISCHSLTGSAGNIISLGYQLVRDRNNSTGCVSSTATVVNKYPNSAIEFLSSKCWQTLHKCIGDGLMIHLLRDVSLFVLVKNHCYMQVAGYPLYNLERIRQEEKEDEGSSAMEDVGMPTQTAQGMLLQESVFQSLPVRQDVPLQQDFRQNVVLTQQLDSQNLAVHPTLPSEEEPVQENMDYENEISQQLMAEQHNSVQEDDRKTQAAQGTAFSRSEAEISVFVEEIPQDVVVAGTNSSSGCFSKQQQQNGQFDGLNDQFKEPQRCKKKVKMMKRKKPSCFEEPLAKKARRCVNFEKPKNNKTKDPSSRLSSDVFSLYFPQPALMYSTNLGYRFPRCHLLSSTLASKRGATKMIEKIFIESKFVFDNKTKQTLVVAKKEGVRREGEKKRNQRLPKRFVGMKGLFERMLKRHKKCRFNALLKHHCKGVLDITEEREKEVEKQVEVQENLVGSQEKPVENQEKLDQVEEEQAGTQKEPVQIQVKAVGLLQSRQNQDEVKGKEDEIQSKDYKSKENCEKKSNAENRSDSGRKVLESKQEQYDRAVKNFTPRFQVVRFVVAVCNRVIPKELWGSSQNKKAFYNNLKNLINLNKGEKYSLGQMVNGIKISDCKWLKSDGTKEKGTPLSESEKQREVFYNWIWWLVRRYIMIVLKSFFYITENSGQTKEIFFYRKPVWKIINDFGVSAMKSDLLKPLSKQEAGGVLGSNSSLGYSHMRFLPKAQNVRPIINMKHQPSNKNSEQKIQASINCKLRNLFEIIKFEKGREPASSDSTVFGNDDVYQALRAFHLKRKERHDERSLYMVHVDINKCFDSIPLDKVYGILEGVFEEEEYIVRRFVAIKSVNDVARKVFNRKVDSGEDCRSFKQFLEDMIQENNLYNVIFVDQVYYNCEDRENILALLRKHLFDNIVKIGSKIYKQIKGIAQGSILSTYLCSYFYSHMEKRYLQQVMQDESSLLMRWVDDFLFLSPDRALADTFLRIMHSGIPEYGCQITSRKTLVNYETTTSDGVPVRCVGPDEPFPWCGFLFHQKSLETKLDFSKYEGKHRNTVLRNLHSHPGRSLLEKLRYSLLNKSHPLLLDTKINSQPTVLSNIYEAFFWSACKFYNYCRDFPKGRKIQENPSLCMRIILALPQYFCAQAKLKFKKLTPKAPKKSSSRKHVFGVSVKDVECLCCQAYVKYLKKKQSFKIVVKALRKRIPRVRGGNIDRARNPGLQLSPCHG